MMTALATAPQARTGFAKASLMTIALLVRFERMSLLSAIYPAERSREPHGSEFDFPQEECLTIERDRVLWQPQGAAPPLAQRGHRDQAKRRTPARRRFDKANASPSPGRAGEVENPCLRQFPVQPLHLTN